MRYLSIKLIFVLSFCITLGDAAAKEKLSYQCDEIAPNRYIRVAKMLNFTKLIRQTTSKERFEVFTSLEACSDYFTNHNGSCYQFQTNIEKLCAEQGGDIYPLTKYCIYCN